MFTSLTEYRSPARTPVKRRAFEGSNRETRASLLAIRDTSKRDYRAAVRARKNATLRRLQKLDLTLDEQCRSKILSFWFLIDTVVDSELARDGDLSEQMAAVVMVLVEARQLTMDLFELGKATKSSSSAILKELTYMQDTIAQLKKMLDAFFYNYGVRRASISSATPATAHRAGPAEHARKTLFQDDGHCGDRDNAQDDEVDEDAENGGAKNAEKQQQQQQEERVKAMQAVMDVLVQAPLLQLGERIQHVSRHVVDELYLRAPDLAMLERQVEVFVGQGYNKIVVLGYIAETVGASIADACLTDTDLRHACMTPLASVFASARSNMWSASAALHDFSLQSVPKPTIEDVDDLLLME